MGDAGRHAHIAAVQLMGAATVAAAVRASRQRAVISFCGRQTFPGAARTVARHLLALMAVARHLLAPHSQSPDISWRCHILGRQTSPGAAVARPESRQTERPEGLPAGQVAQTK